MFYNKEVDYFISDFVNELMDENVAIFAGAGLSGPSGFVDWKGLMKDFSNQIGATGFAAEKLWNEVINNYDNYYIDTDKLEVLKKLGDDSLTNKELIDLILKFINNG